MEKQSRWHSLALFALLCVIALSSSLYFSVTEPELLNVTALLGLSFPLVVVLVVFAYVSRYGDHPQGRTYLAAGSVSSVAMSITFAVGGVLIVVSQQTQGVDIADPGVLIVELGLGGGLVGLGVGHLYGRTVIQRQRLSTRQQRLQVLTRILRHDLRNRLAVVRSHIEQATATADDSVTSHLSTAIDAVEELLETAETVRDVQTQLDDHRRHRQDLGSLVEEVVRRTDDTYEETVTLSTPPETLWVVATSGLGEALWELLSNACEHGRGPITVSVQRETTTAVVEITDRGDGIPEDELTVIETGTETPLEHTSGLGLWIATWIIEESEGSIRFESNGETTVRVTLPVTADTVSSAVDRKTP